MKNRLNTLNLSSRTSISLAHGVMALVTGILIFSTGTSAWSQQEVASTPPVYSVLYTFQGAPDGADPFGDGIGDGNGTGSLAVDSEGNLYGTTAEGGSCGSFGCGVVFKIGPAGEETVLHSFDGADGAVPQGGVVLDGAGDLYGTTLSGGPDGYGVIYKLDRAGNYTVLHSFTGGADGNHVYGGLVREESGNIFGETLFGGLYGQGVIFKVNRAGNYTVLHSFTGGADGSVPSGLVVDRQGTFYGTTESGGPDLNGCNGFGCGVVFKLDRAGNETVLYNFTGGIDGEFPIGGVRLDNAGNLYGTTIAGGAYGAGVVFKLKTTGEERALYSFTGGADGGNPGSPMVWDYYGNLYGTAQIGGASGCGVVFRVNPQGKETVLHTFTQGAGDGCYPQSGLTRVGKNVLYGTTFFGGLEGGNPQCGTSGCGVVFMMTLPNVSDQIEEQREDLGEETKSE